MEVSLENCQHQTSWGNGIMKRERSVESYGKGKHFGWVEEGLVNEVVARRIQADVEEL